MCAVQSPHVDDGRRRRCEHSHTQCWSPQAQINLLTKNTHIIQTHTHTRSKRSHISRHCVLCGKWQLYRTQRTSKPHHAPSSIAYKCTHHAHTHRSHVLVVKCKFKHAPGRAICDLVCGGGCARATRMRHERTGVCGHRETRSVVSDDEMHYSSTSSVVYAHDAVLFFKCLCTTCKCAAHTHTQTHPQCAPGYMCVYIMYVSG